MCWELVKGSCEISGRKIILSSGPLSLLAAVWWGSGVEDERKVKKERKKGVKSWRLCEGSL